MIPTVQVHFHGPFAWANVPNTQNIFEAKLGRKAGIYFWTIKTNEGELVYYVGQTGREFAVRMLEHFREHTSGGYHIYDPDALSQGEHIQLWPGRFDPDAKTTIAEFLDQFSTLADVIEQLAKMYRFYLAPIEGDRRLRERMEAGLASHLYRQEGIVGEFQDKGIRHLTRRENESPIQVRIEADANLLGIPEVLWV